MNGTTYNYLVIALDQVGNASDPSEEASATAQPPGVNATMRVGSIERRVRPQASR
jgi:hypothetical protein